jgi:hypothetical protein
VDQLDQLVRKDKQDHKVGAQLVQVAQLALKVLLDSQALVVQGHKGHKGHKA